MYCLYGSNKSKWNVGIAPVIRETAIDYYYVREEEDTFPDASNFDPPDLDQKDDIDRAVFIKLKKAEENGLSIEREGELCRLVTKNIDIFRTPFASGPPAKVGPLRIKLKNETKPICVRIQNYSLG